MAGVIACVTEYRGAAVVNVNGGEQMSDALRDGGPK